MSSNCFPGIQKDGFELVHREIIKTLANAIPMKRWTLVTLRWIASDIMKDEMANPPKN
jgi:hypothetical protein